MIADSFDPFNAIRAVTDRQGQSFDLDMHQLSGFGDLIRAVLFKPLFQDTSGTAGDDLGQALDHLFLQLGVAP